MPLRVAVGLVVIGQRGVGRTGGQRDQQGREQDFQHTDTESFLEAFGAVRYRHTGSARKIRACLLCR